MKALATICALGCCEFREHYRCVETAVIKEKYHKLYEFMGFRRQRAGAGAFGGLKSVKRFEALETLGVQGCWKFVA